MVLDRIKTEIYVYNASKNFEYLNEAALQASLGNQVLGKTDLELCSHLGISSEVASERLKKLELVFETKSALTSEECIHYSNGTVRYFIQYYIPILNENNRVQFVIRQAIDVSEKVLIQKEFEYLANHDPLTGLPNRRLLFQTLEQRLNLHNELIGILLLDLDRFKLVNDTLGHSYGDELIRSVTGRLLNYVASIENSLLARLGGDEFVIACFDLKSIEELENISKKLISLFEKPFSLRDQQIFITTSIGVYSFYTGNETETVESVIHKADASMYSAKENGRNFYCFYKEGMKSKNQSLFSIESQIYNSLVNEGFTIALQPKIFSHNGKITGAEVLLRWKNEELYPIYDVIQAADTTHLINQIGYYSIGLLFHFISENKSLLSDLNFTVNLTETQFYDPNLVNILIENSTKYDVPLNKIELEIKENTIMKNTKRSTERINILRRTGVKVGIDDYGSGSSSLSYLKECKIDFINIDKSFVKDITENTQDAAITSAIATMAHKLQITICAEGIENKEQALFLKYLKCHLLQGFYFSYPLKKDDFSNLIQSEITYLPLLAE